MIKQTLTTIILTSLILLNCGPSIPEPNPQEALNHCQPACVNLEKLGCEKGKPLLTPWECTSSAECPEENKCIAGYCGVTCAQSCENTVRSGKMLETKCWSEVSSCSELSTKCVSSG